jgi:general secretion pathway protein J
MWTKQAGFTLMEVLVALFIMSIMSITAVSGLNAVLRSQSHQVKIAQQIQALQFTYSWLEQDLGQYVKRDVLNTHDERLPSIMFNNDSELSKVGVDGRILLVLTRGGITDPKNLSSLQRIAYALKDQQLIRYTWPVLDAVSETVVRQNVILNHVTDIELRYLSNQGTYYNNWNDYTGKALLPMAMEWQITNDKGQKLTWLFAITGGDISNETNETKNETTK